MRENHIIRRLHLNQKHDEFGSNPNSDRWIIIMTLNMASNFVQFDQEIISRYHLNMRTLVWSTGCYTCYNNDMLDLRGIFIKSRVGKVNEMVGEPRRGNMRN